ncbi:hypothetical protein ACLF6K_00235 [Streptomyces xanthophaeus]|uniref:hypothetical protein n=1 Tax=Streptomyces xanthophaeus TaxID=67385 RepID=UPI00398F9FA0
MAVLSLTALGVLGFAGPAAADAPQIVKATFKGLDSAQGNAMCPDGSHAISGGVGSPNEVAVVTASHPTPDGKGWHGHITRSGHVIQANVYVLCQTD